MVSAIIQSPALSMSDALGEIVERISPAIVSVRDGRRGSGTGIVWSTNTVITNHHVVHRDHATLLFAGGRESTGEVIGRDPHNDIVALRVADAPPPAPIGDSTTLRIGQIVLAIGHPLGLDNAVTVGVVSGLPAPSDPRAMIRSDLHLHPGNSGGPLLTAGGLVAGINAMVAGRGTALSVPEHTIRAFLARLGGESPVLGLDLSAVEIPPSWRDAFGVNVERGLLITAVEAGSPAEAARLYPGDILVRVGDQAAQHPLRVREVLAFSGHEPITLSLLRAGLPVEITIPASGS